jgi:hypothetical protein
LAEKHGLRGFDAIHLSSALTLRQELSAPVIFSCSDLKLQKASQLEELYQPLLQPRDEQELVKLVKDVPRFSPHLETVMP